MQRQLQPLTTHTSTQRSKRERMEARVGDLIIGEGPEQEGAICLGGVQPYVAA